MKPSDVFHCSFALLFAVTLPACLTVGDSNPTDGGVPDRVTSVDFNNDTATPPDFATPPDLLRDLLLADLTPPPPDLTPPPPDLKTPPDLMPPPPDLVPPPDLTPPPPDLTPPPPDLTPPPPDLAGQIPYANATELCQYIIAGRADGVAVSTQRYLGIPNQGSYANPSPAGWLDVFTINQSLMTTAQTLADQIQANPSTINRGIPFGPDGSYKAFFLDGNDEMLVNHSLDSAAGPSYYWNEASTDWANGISPITRGTVNAGSITGGSELMRRSLYRHDNQLGTSIGKIGCGIATVGAGQARWLVVMIRP